MIVEWRIVRAPWYKRMVGLPGWYIQRKTKVDPWTTIDRHHTKEGAEMSLRVVWRVR